MNTNCVARISLDDPNYDSKLKAAMQGGTSTFSGMYCESAMKAGLDLMFELGPTATGSAASGTQTGAVDRVGASIGMMVGLMGLSVVLAGM